MNALRAMTCGTIVALATIAAPAGAAYAEEGRLIPEWVKTLFAFYINDEITEGEVISALEYLIAQDIIHVSSATEQRPAAPVGQAADAGAGDAIIKAGELSEAANDAIIKAGELSECRA